MNQDRDQDMLDLEHPFVKIAESAEIGDLASRTREHYFKSFIEYYLSAAARICYAELISAYPERDVSIRYARIQQRIARACLAVLTNAEILDRYRRDIVSHAFIKARQYFSALSLTEGVHRVSKWNKDGTLSANPWFRPATSYIGGLIQVLLEKGLPVNLPPGEHVVNRSVWETLDLIEHAKIFRQDLRQFLTACRLFYCRRVLAPGEETSIAHINHRGVLERVLSTWASEQFGFSWAKWAGFKELIKDPSTIGNMPYDTIEGFARFVDKKGCLVFSAGRSFRNSMFDLTMFVLHDEDFDSDPN